MMYKFVIVFCLLICFGLCETLRLGPVGQTLRLTSSRLSKPTPFAPPPQIKLVPLHPAKFDPSSSQPLTEPAPTSLIKVVASIVVAWLIHAGSAQAKDLDKGATLFQKNCALCHAGGTTVFVSTGTKSLRKTDLELNNYTTKEDIVKLLVKGKGLMPPYLGASDQDMQDVAEFVLDKATEGTW
jgi:cytochrome c6